MTATPEIATTPIDEEDVSSYWSKESGLDPYAYEHFRGSIDSDRRDCCYPPIIGSIVTMGVGRNGWFLARITRWGIKGFGWEALGDGTTGVEDWDQEVGVVGSDGWWSFA